MQHGADNKGMILEMLAYTMEKNGEINLLVFHPRHHPYLWTPKLNRLTLILEKDLLLDLSLTFLKGYKKFDFDLIDFDFLPCTLDARDMTLSELPWQTGDHLNI